MGIGGRAWGRRSPLAWFFSGLLGLGVLVGAGLPGTPANAHAIIQSSEPAAGAVVAGPDVEIVLHFNSRLDHGRSRLTLRRADGSVTPLAILAPAADPTAIAARARGLAPGAWLLHWQVLATDGHLTHGDIPFTVGPFTVDGR
jgi:hypothetical protein